MASNKSKIENNNNDKTEEIKKEENTDENLPELEFVKKEEEKQLEPKHDEEKNQEIINGIKEENKEISFKIIFKKFNCLNKPINIIIFI